MDTDLSMLFLNDYISSNTGRILRTPPHPGLVNFPDDTYDFLIPSDPIEPKNPTNIIYGKNTSIDDNHDKQNPSFQTNFHDPESLFDPSISYEFELSTENMNSQSSSDNDDDVPFDAKQWLIQDVELYKSRPPKLHEFLRLLLDNERYVSYASWLNKDDGFFRIHKPDQVANFWTKVKGRKTSGSLNYNIFARSIRYYYKSGIMIKTHKRYTYRFGSV